MCYLKEKSFFVVGMLLCLALVLLHPGFVYSQNGFDQTPPTVEEVSPENGQADVPVNTSIFVTFSETMDTFFTGNPFSFFPAIPGQIFWELEQTLIFQPDMFLTYDTTYQVSVDTQAVDESGKSLQSPYQWSFITESNSWIHYDEIQGISLLDQQMVQALLEANNGDLWVALGPSGHLYRFDGSVFHQITGSLGSIKAMAQDNAGRIWVVSEPDSSQTGGGIHVYNGQNWTHYTSANSNLDDDDMKCITIDSKGRIWVGSTSSGIYRLSGQSWLNYNTGNSSLSDMWVTAIHADVNDQIWIGTVFGGIDIFNPDTGIWNTLTSEIESLLGTSLPQINALAYGGGHMWIGTNAGLLRYNISLDEWALFSQQGGDLPNDDCMALLWNPGQNRLWVGTLGGPATFDGLNWDIPHLLDAGPEIMNLASDPYGRIWMGTNNSLSVYDTVSPALLSFTPVNNQKNVSKKSHVILNFSEPMDPDAVLGVLHMTPSFSYTSSWDTHYTKLTLKPKNPLNYDTKYHVTLSEEASDQVGHPMVNAYAWSFTTEKEPTSQSSTSSSYGFNRPYTGFSNSFSFFGYSTSSNLSNLTRNLSSFSYSGYPRLPTSSFTSYTGSSLSNFGFTNLPSYNYGSSYFTGTTRFSPSYQLGSSYFQNMNRNFQISSFMTSNIYLNNLSRNFPRY